ncbi:hypothetical protein ACFY5C_39930 [Streptomyces sp. NPDC012935]|uniref:hypothetical protein n=1 Tax=Streptomyces sp. NPDC012935 TaxID=3364857 RepID=UPI0036A725F9
MYKIQLAREQVCHPLLVQQALSNDYPVRKQRIRDGNDQKPLGFVSRNAHIRLGGVW